MPFLFQNTKEDILAEEKPMKSPSAKSRKRRRKRPNQSTTSEMPTVSASLRHQTPEAIECARLKRISKKKGSSMDQNDTKEG
jgi:hypothetical protein